MPPNPAEAQAEIWSFFVETRPRAVVGALELKGAAEPAISEERLAGQADEFSLFVEAHAREAAGLADDLIVAARTRLAALREEMAGDETERRAALVAVAVEACREIREERNPELAEAVLMMFLTHFREAEGYLIPPLAVRAPYRILPSGPKAGATAPEDKLDWFREDPLFNEHHEHWHIVYPFAGILGRTRDRQGEMFLYMHQQMLARYDAERLAVGLPPTTAYDDLTTPMSSGYDPGAFINAAFPYHAPRPAGLKLGDLNRPMYGFPGHFRYTLAAQITNYERLQSAVRSGVLRTREGRYINIEPNLLGHTIEASALENIDVDYYGSFHNNGHRFMAACHDPDYAKGAPLGVMARPETSFRDPIFFQWHKTIDTLSVTWQDNRAINDLADSPAVKLRSGLDEAGAPWSLDLILCKREAVELLRQQGLSVQAIADGAFGGRNWNTDLTCGETRWVDPQSGQTQAIATVGEIRTFMEVDEIIYDGVPYTYEYLNHEPITFFIRIQNRRPDPLDVTVRLFIVPEEFADDRTKYIELDKFRTRLVARGQGQNVIWRHDEQSSIVRKPAILDPGAYNRTYDPSFGGWLLAEVAVYLQGADELAAKRTALLSYHDGALRFRRERFGEDGDFDAIEAQLTLSRLRLEADLTQALVDAYKGMLEAYHAQLTTLNVDRAYCGCGYPYSLLFPRGTRAGMPFRLVALVTDWQLDRVEEEHHCASMSFCGAKARYPDMRAMGYPFDRPFPGGVGHALAALPNAASRRVVVRQLK